jgi:hypothetical protein
MATERRTWGRAGSALCAIVLTVAAAGAFLALLPATAGAAGEPAVIVKGTPCTMAGADAQGNQIDGGTGVVALKVENRSNVVLKHIASAGTLINLSGRTQTYKGFQCFIRSPVSGARLETYDSNATVTVDGGGQATCKYTKR